MGALGFEFESISATADNANTVIAGRAGERIVVFGYALNVNAAGTTTINAEDGNIVFEFVDGGGVSHAGSADVPAFAIAPGADLTITNAVGVDTTGHITFKRLRARG